MEAATVRDRSLIAWCAIGLLLGAAFVGGLAARRATWEVTKPIRFGDIQNGFYWAWISSGPQGYLNQYEKMANEQFDWGRWLDYAPLRLLLMNRWGTWVRRHYTQPIDAYEQKPWNPPYAFNEPVLDFNTVMDLLAAVCTYSSRLWIIRVRQRDKRLITPFTGVIPGLVAALTVWFNPAMLLSAYGWPTWDAWIVPMYLLAALLATLDWWFAAGLAIAVGAMFKGQQLTVAPVFILWALVLGQLGSAARWCAGLIAGIAVVASPWLFTYLPAKVLEHVRWTHGFNYDADVGYSRIIEYPAIFWVLGIIAATIAIPLIARRIAVKPRGESTKGCPPWKIIPASNWMWLLLGGFVIWPWFIPRNVSHLWLGAILSMAMVVAARRLRGHALACLVAGRSAGSLACSACLSSMAAMPGGIAESISVPSIGN